jgi:hypothetical protein
MLETYRQVKAFGHSVQVRLRGKFKVPDTSETQSEPVSTPLNRVNNYYGNCQQRPPWGSSRNQCSFLQRLKLAVVGGGGGCKEKTLPTSARKGACFFYLLFVVIAAFQQ